jgi:protein-tyrosine kinase
MENIRQAVERARAARGLEAKDPKAALNRPSTWQPRAPLGTSPGAVDDWTLDLSAKHLEAHRVISHDTSDPRSTTYDMLRTQVLRSMDLNARRVLAITSATAACGKTLTSINLALSIARQPGRSVLLLDMDIQKGQVAKYLGLTFEDGLLGVLEGRVSLHDAVIKVRAGKTPLMVLPTEVSTVGSSDWMTSEAMGRLFEQVRRDFSSQIIIVDLPPMLYGDDVIAILPQIDCVLLVAAVGTSSIAEIQECNKYLQSSEVVRLVLNKVTEPNTNYYYY